MTMFALVFVFSSCFAGCGDKSIVAIYHRELLRGGVKGFLVHAGQIRHLGKLNVELRILDDLSTGFKFDDFR